MIGIIIATLREAQPLIDCLAATHATDEPLPTYRFDGAGASEEPAEAGGVIVISGMGGQLAEAATEYLIDTCGATAALNIGICGGLTEAGEPHRTLLVTAVTDGDQPADDAPVIPLPAPAGQYGNLSSATLASVAQPVFQPDRRADLTDRADIVDMEGFAVASVCADRDVPLTMLKTVSDLADHNGKADIQANIDVLSVKLAELVADDLRQPDKKPDVANRILNFTKVEHSIFSLPLLFAGAMLGAAGRWPSLRTLALIAVAGVGARTLGMAANRILDRKLDALNRRTAGRELPSGKMSLALAIGVAIGGAALYVLAAAALGPVCLKLSPIPAVFLIAYSLGKRFTCLCHFGIGVSLALAPLGAFVAVSGDTNFTPAAWLLALFTFCWISGFDIIYALQDIDSDRQTGVRSMPARLGFASSQFVAAGVHLVAVVALAGLFVLVGGGALPMAAAAVAVVAFVAAYWQRLPLAARFFPISAIAGVAGAMVPLLGELQ